MPTGSRRRWARTLGAKHCVAVANGTSALITSLAALGIGPGDEVIVPPYTFVATINAVLMHHALPVFVDTDPETFQIDARKIEAAITERHGLHHAGAPGRLGGRHGHDPGGRRQAQAAGRRRRLPGRTWPSGGPRSSARSATSAASASRPPRTSTRAKAGRSSPITTTCSSNARAFRTTAGAADAGFSLRPQRGQPADDRVPGRAAIAAAHPARRAIPPPRAERRLPHRAAPRDPRHRPGPDVRRLHPQCLSPLHVSL